MKDAITNDPTWAVLNDVTEFRLPHDKWQEFCDLLDEPARELPALQKLFSEVERFKENPASVNSGKGNET